MAQPQLGTSTADVPSFYDELRDALRSLRTAIIELLIAVGADPARPQELSRTFDLNKNLTWKISKIVGETDLFATVPHIPGTPGFEIFLKALARAGAPAHLVDEARNASSEFDRVIKLHTGDRATLEIMIGEKLPAGIQSEHGESNRKRAFQGNSAIWGVRAKTQLTLMILAPNADEPDMADLVQVSGIDRFRRLRPDARWLLFRRERWSDDDPHPGPDVLESLDPSFPISEGVPLLGEFCTKPLPGIELISDEGEDQYELPPGAVGNTAAFTCIHGQVARKVGPAYAEKDGEYSELGCNLITPAEHLVFDLLVHRDFEWAMSPELLMYSRMDGGGMHVAARRDRNRLAIAEPVQDVGNGIAGLATPLMPRYTKLVRYVFDSLEWDPDDFRSLRFTMTFPPIPTVALLRSRLPVRP